MAEQNEKSTRRSGGGNDQAQASSTGVGTPVAGRRQLGEELPEGGVSTRVPRGVDEPAADADASEKGVAAVQRGVKEAVAKESEQGFRGQRTDPTPNENYTVKGVTSGAPTPETVVVTPKGQR